MMSLSLAVSGESVSANRFLLAHPHDFILDRCPSWIAIGTLDEPRSAAVAGGRSVIRSLQGLALEELRLVTPCLRSRHISQRRWCMHGVLIL